MTTMRDAVKRYFEVNGFGADGGYTDAWVDFKLGPVPFPLPNTAARVRAVRFHDLNHVLTGYATDFSGELEISAWEIGAGCRSFAAAWVLNLAGMTAGAFKLPKKTWRAFVAGRRSTATYGLDYEATLSREVDELRQALHVVTSAQATVGDGLRFAGCMLAGAGVGLLMVVALLNPLTLALWLRNLRSRARRHTA